MYYGQNKIFGEILELMAQQVSVEVLEQLKTMICKYAEVVKTTALNGMDKSTIEANRKLKDENEGLLKRIELSKFEKDHNMSDLIENILKARQDALEQLTFDIELIKEKIQSFISEELGLSEDCEYDEEEFRKFKLIDNLIDSLRKKHVAHALLENRDNREHLLIILNNIEDLINVISPSSRR